MFNKTKLQNGVHLYIRKTEQFKTVNVTIKWKAPLDQKKASERTVLANVMEDSTKQYPTLSSMRKVLDELYGTVLFTDVSKRSSQHIVSLYTEKEKNVMSETVFVLFMTIKRVSHKSVCLRS